MDGFAPRYSLLWKLENQIARPSLILSNSPAKEKKNHSLYRILVYIIKKKKKKVIYFQWTNKSDDHDLNYDNWIQITIMERFKSVLWTWFNLFVQLLLFILLYILPWCVTSFDDHCICSVLTRRFLFPSEVQNYFLTSDTLQHQLKIVFFNLIKMGTQTKIWCMISRSFALTTKIPLHYYVIFRWALVGKRKSWFLRNVSEEGDDLPTT